ncbi:DUF4350 domain-containing protein [Leifsonia sp. 71-9]|uniref:DUF4350 domain-containing protein n=1 Tax=Leifsonia sp. 71-9 TaxID=1895934 RepID=UPI0009265341|nr:DUF4350 domain-containing protein [Leifsonia sp. 71-9]OJX73876.1 MAG: hypothetical protein BGO91_16680 [Leifsonia sp. 71-9]
MTTTRTPDRPTETSAPVEATSVSPTVRQTGRRALPWVVLGAIAVVVALAGILLTGGRSHSGAPLDPGSAAPTGGKALAQVLGARGVDVRSATSLEQVRTDTAGGDATVLVFDDAGNLEASAYRELAQLAKTIVIVEPSFQTLREVAPGARASGEPTGPADAGCGVAAAQRAERIDPRATANTAGSTVPGTFRLQDDGAACFADASGAASLVRTTFTGTTVYLVGSAPLLMNDGVDREGNAALGLTLLGQHRTLVWYLPGLDDRPVTGPPDIAALTPGWVTPVLLLLVLVFVAAAVWRGRRFGPLVVENLPVVVRAGETREGRARLYQRSSARLRAADSLRIGTVGRLAAVAGLPRTATTTEVADAIAALVGRDRQQIRGLLVDDIPRTDGDLVALSDHLAELERAAAAAVSPADAGPTGRMEP